MASRSITECLRLAKSDIGVCTSLLEARFLWGDTPTFETLRTRFDAEIKRIEGELRRAVEGMKSALARKDFDEAVAFHDEEVTLRRRHEELKQRYETECNKILDVGHADVEEVIARWTGIPIQSVAARSSFKLNATRMSSVSLLSVISMALSSMKGQRREFSSPLRNTDPTRTNLPRTSRLLS